MKINTRRVLEDCIENGVKFGLSRAHKHIENPSEDVILDHIHREIMNQVDEYFSFSDENTFI